MSSALRRRLRALCTATLNDSSNVKQIVLLGDSQSCQPSDWLEQPPGYYVRFSDSAKTSNDLGRMLNTTVSKSTLADADEIWVMYGSNGSTWSSDDDHAMQSIANKLAETRRDDTIPIYFFYNVLGAVANGVARTKTPNPSLVIDLSNKYTINPPKNTCFLVPASGGNTRIQFDAHRQTYRLQDMHIDSSRHLNTKGILLLIQLTRDRKAERVNNDDIEL